MVMCTKERYQHMLDPLQEVKTGSEMSYAVPMSTNPRDPVYHKGPSQMPKVPESVAASYATITKFDNKGQKHRGPDE